MGKKRDPRIIETEKPYIERERKFVPVVPPAVAAQGEDAVAAYKSQKLLEIADHVRMCADTFVTADHPDLAPVIPVALHTEKFLPEAERTRPRERIYYADADLKVRTLSAEFRQEAHKRDGVKQTVKIARHTGREKDKDGATLNRTEMHAKLTGPGVCLTAVDDVKIQRWLTKNFRESALKPAFRIVSQRIRIPYHPEGNTDVVIEVACDNILFGETIFGRTWQDPKLEIEIIKGPEDEEACRKILEREERRLIEKFDLIAQTESNAEMGYAQLAADLATAAGRAKLSRIGARDVWWTREGRTKIGLK